MDRNTDYQTHVASSMDIMAARARLRAANRVIEQNVKGTWDAHTHSHFARRWRVIDTVTTILALLDATTEEIDLEDRKEWEQSVQQMLWDLFNDEPQEK